MDFLICDSDRMELAELSGTEEIDFDLGDTNDVQIKCERGLMDFGLYLICPGTEFGALIEEKDVWTNETEETWSGDAFRGLLEQIIIEPPSGEDYYTVSGDANDIIRDIISDKYEGMFTVPDEESGITISSYSFARYTDALTGLTAMLKEQDARININIVQGDSNEAFSVEVSAVLITDYSEEIEYSQDAQIAVNITECRRGITHLICLGQGELADRIVIHLYLQGDGSVSQTQYYTGMQERTAAYDYANAEDETELISGGTERLLELAPSKTIKVSVEDTDLQVGDIVAGRDYESGLYVAKPIVQKILTVKDGVTEIEYKTEGAE